MKLLSIRAKHFKNLGEDFHLSFIAKAKKTSEDKEYELHEIAEGLYAFNTVAFVGKNASGKTSVLQLLDLVFSVLGDCQVQAKLYPFDGVGLDVIFYHEGFVYRYLTDLRVDARNATRAVFANQALYRKPYFKTNAKSVLDLEGFVQVQSLTPLPDDTSIVFFVLKKAVPEAVYFDCDGHGYRTYKLLFDAVERYSISPAVLTKVLRLFDPRLRSLQVNDERSYRLSIGEQTMVFTDYELWNYLSLGTTKGLLLYITVVASLSVGFDVMIDEIENHFHKTLVENVISLYKDKSINRHNATLYFSTHYCELLDLFNRQDNIWICQPGEPVLVKNMYEHFDNRPELLKSKLFYRNAFGTAVDYDDLMAVKTELYK